MDKKLEELIWNGPPFGDGPWSEDDENGATVRGFLRLLTFASEDPEIHHEVNLWTSVHEGVPMVEWTRRWLDRRVGVLFARVAGFPHTYEDVIDYSSAVAEESGGPPALSRSRDGRFMIFDFPNASWLAFERSEEVRLPAIGFSAQPWCWRQLDLRPAVDLVERGSLATEALRSGDPELAREFADATDEVFGARLNLSVPASPPLACVVCSAPIKAGLEVLNPEGQAAHVECWAAREVDPGAPYPDPGIDYEDLPFELPSIEEVAAVRKEEDKLRGDGRPLTASAPAPEGELETQSAPAPALAGFRLNAACVSQSTPGCVQNLVLPAENWALGIKLCVGCGEPLMAWPAGAGRPLGTADQSPGRPLAGAWICGLCGEPSWRHLRYTEGASYSHPGCAKFEAPTPTDGSICRDCLHVCPWDATAPGVWNVCDRCAQEGTLVPYSGRAQFEALREEITAKGRVVEKVTEPEAPLCEACKEEPARVRFTRAAKSHPILLACEACANEPSVRGRRTSFVEV